MPTSFVIKELTLGQHKMGVSMSMPAGAGAEVTVTVAVTVRRHGGAIG